MSSDRREFLSAVAAVGAAVTLAKFPEALSAGGLPDLSSPPCQCTPAKTCRLHELYEHALYFESAVPMATGMVVINNSPKLRGVWWGAYVITTHAPSWLRPRWFNHKAVRITREMTPDSLLKDFGVDLRVPIVRAWDHLPVLGQDIEVMQMMGTAKLHGAKAAAATVVFA